ncbi:uncharacterized protein NECHADRAFT_82115 [Fusarium vanettenii 77-13-4]|uniref:Uncharacterized protein n=1 Tax=Fusarium vanettenii (strain ATCC MYA-4622 / CBS 123669 / FGSC 9596 / NRRL 45880 / 77-13-4) TaxID=660122 RepID=C7ZAJ1_FUSV7|nr:uncharacterized protein NECHADRAFT_82115 [Fusarium vanettenii 77-13-4]EEU39283.1 hypothetical protein NECHADRAFT_82115 [Fusarium vanettenii 77-13-4]
MDPLSAVGLAGNIVQFIQFAASLFEATKEIHQSATGVSQNHTTLQVIYERLSDFCNKLETDFDETIDNGGVPKSQAKKGSSLSLIELATACHQECKQLLSIVDSLRAKYSARSKPWRSFCVALRGVLITKEIEGLEARIASYQAQMVLHLCSATRGAIRDIGAHIQAFRSEGQSFHNCVTFQLGDISRALGNLTSRVQQMEDRNKIKKFQKGLYEDDYEPLTAKISELSLQSQKCINEYELLSSLNYEQRLARHENIKNAHHKTFSWIFKDDGGKTDETRRLISWLREGCGIFWVSGRPGSGKSTFMKFIAGHLETTSLLSLWANDRVMIKASHYFWSSGTDVQRSQEGLLRSLIFDILGQSPALIPIACPGRWSRIISGDMSHDTSWTMRELRETIQRIAKQTRLPIKFCFFIDGLDEFEGDRPELLKSLEELSECQDIKLLVSSRAWNDFVQRFSQRPKLHLHNLTHGDIRRFSESQLLEHPNWKDLASQVGETQALTLVDEISDRARGVFLWVFLVTRLLREGMTNYDTFFELQDRLKSVPIDLENFFKAMLDSVEPFYHPKMAGTLQLAITAREPLPITIYSFHDLGYERPNYAMDEQVEMWSAEDEQKFQAPFSRRLAARCKELLEVQGNKVEFLHRTVRDFLRYAEMRTYLAGKAPENFDASFSIFRAFCAWTKHTNFLGMTIFDLDQKHLRILVSDLTGYITKKMNQDYCYLDDQLVSPLSVVLQMEGSADATERGWTKNRVQLLRYLLESGDFNPNEVHLCSEGSVRQSPWASFLATILSEDSQSGGSMTAILEAGIVPLLLEYGSDVNMTLNLPYRNGELRLPVWAQFLSIIFLPNRLSTQTAAYIQVLEKVLEGAELDTASDFIDFGSWQDFLKLDAGENGDGPREMTCKLAMFRIITSSLQKMSIGPRRNHLDIQLIARAIETFLKHTNQPPEGLSELYAAIQSAFPPNLVRRFRRFLETTSGDDMLVQCEKRGLLDENDEEARGRELKIRRTVPRR